MNLPFPSHRHRLLAVTALAALTLFILACGDDTTPTATRPAVTNTPTT